MKKVILALALVTVSAGIFAQKKTTTSATVAFDASTAADALPKAENKTVVAAVDPTTGSVAFEANVKNFAFSNPTIQEHFNGPKWLDSEKYPNFSFKGNIVNLSSVDFTKDGSYNTEVEGTLTVKGIEQKVKVPAKVGVKAGVITASSSFSIKLADYDISGVPITSGKVSKEPKVTVNAEFK